LFQRPACGFDIEDELGQSPTRIPATRAIASAKQ
jgi:hypothetical protein